MKAWLLAFALVVIGSGGVAAAAEARQGQDEAAGVVSADDQGGSSTSPSLRLALAFWLPVYYGLFVWLLTAGEGGGGAKRRVRDYHRLAPVTAVAPARPTRMVRRG